MKRCLLVFFLSALVVSILSLSLFAQPTQRQGVMPGNMMMGHMALNPSIGQCLMGHGMMGYGMMGSGMMGSGMMDSGMMGHGMRGKWTPGQMGMVAGVDKQFLEKMRKLQRNQAELMLALTEENVDLQKARSIYDRNLTIWHELALMRFDNTLKYMQQQ